MAKVTFVKKAQKDQPAYGIKKGDSYYWWKFRFGGKHVSKTLPKQSQLINSPFLSTIQAVSEGLQELPEKAKPKDIEAAVDDAKSELENLRDETQEKFDNMPDGLQQGDTGQLLEERVSSIEDMISELDSIDFENEDAVSQAQSVEYQGS